MQIGAIIEKGPQDWQILQQTKGKANIELSGSWVLPEELEGQGQVFVRIVREDSGDIVCSWTKCQALDFKKWQVTLQDLPVGGLYRLETCLMSQEHLDIEWGIRGDMIHHLGIGDVFVITGQSNSSGYGKDPIYDPPDIGVHIYKNSGRWDLASHPLNESTDTIHIENREGANPGHSPYLSFAKMLKRELGYPIGFIQASLGGSPLSAWNPDEDGILYKSMMESINSQGGRVAGVLWYQGCSDAVEGLCDTYLKRFGNFVDHFRKDIDDDRIPFLTVQLNRCVSLQVNDDEDIYWGTIREAQRQAAKDIAGVYVIPAIDCTLSDGIHISSASNMILGERLAKAALTEVYGKIYLSRAPEISSARRLDHFGVELEFDNINQRLYMYDIGAQDLPFTIVDEDGKLEIKSYRISGKNSIIINLNRELNGKSFIHGAYERNPSFILPIDVDSHLPMLSFYGLEIY